MYFSLSLFQFFLELFYFWMVKYSRHFHTRKIYFTGERFTRYRINNEGNVGECYFATLSRGKTQLATMTASVQSCCSVSSSLRAFSRVSEYVSGAIGSAPNAREATRSKWGQTSATTIQRAPRKFRTTGRPLDGSWTSLNVSLISR